MRKLLLSSALMLTIVLISKAQHIEATPFAGYTFGSSFNFNGGKANLSDGFTYGGILSYQAGNMSLDLTYSREDAKGSAHSYDNYIDVNDAPVSVNYVFLGGSRLYPLSDETILFTGLNMGVGFMSNQDYRSVTKFSVGFNGGVKYFFSERIGLRLQASLNFPITDMSSEFWWSPGASHTYGVTSYVPILQFGFTGGLVFRLK
jgi:hypothetical protein